MIFNSLVIAVSAVLAVYWLYGVARIMREEGRRDVR